MDAELRQMYQERLAQIALTRPAAHYALYAQLKKQQPMQMAKIIAESFEQIYPETSGVHEQVLSHLHPDFEKKQRISFDTLNRQLASLEYIFDEESSCLELVESLRQIFQVLPKPETTYREEGRASHLDKSFPQNNIPYRKCRFCWRMVWTDPVKSELRRGMPLCSFHNFKMEDGKPLHGSDIKRSEYQRYKRLEKRAIPLWIEIQGRFLQAQTNELCKHEEWLTPHLFALLTALILPNVSEFIFTELRSNPEKYGFSLEDTLGALFASLESSPTDDQLQGTLLLVGVDAELNAKLVRAIIDILDPAINLSDSLAQAREQFVQNMILDFAMYVSYLYEAESWIEVEKSMQHGGSRNLKI